MRSGTNLAILLLLTTSVRTLAAAPPQLAITVSLPTESFKADEEVPAEVWLANSSDLAMEQVSVEIAGPSSVSLVDFSTIPPPVTQATHEVSGSAATPQPPTPINCTKKKIILGPILPHGVLNGKLRLCLSSEIKEGDFNLLFVFRSRSSAGESFVAVEKKVAIGLFGLQTVGGISLSLVSMFVPGLFFLWVFPLFWGRGKIAPGLGQGAWALLISALLVFLGAVAYPPDNPGAVSLWRFLLLVALAGVLGLSIGLSLRRLGRWMLVEPEDLPPAVMRKLLRLRHVSRCLQAVGVVHPLITENPEVRLRNGQLFSGCLLGPAQSGYVLVDTLIIVGAKHETRAKLNELRKSDSWIKMLSLAENKNLTFYPSIVMTKDSKVEAGFQPYDWKKPLDQKEIEIKHRSYENKWIPIELA